MSHAPTTAGAILERRSRQTGELVAVLDLRDPDSDWASTEDEEGCRWMMFCDAHGGLASMPTRADAVAMVSSPAEWCPGCQD